ncbi:dCTP deaminase domain-containing protein [Stenotrophomonas sp. 22692]|uniref:dCTP deaminase domain-containing protein n=1 Tax=Stenotrophomonas sp. 22692 TaxID=3453956 RepID=UPI003F87102B
MTVVKISGNTTKCKEDFWRFASSIDSRIYADADPQRIEEFSIEITLGDGWNDRYSPHDSRMWSIDQDITIGPQGSIVVEAAEELIIPNNRYGIVLPTGSLFLTKGLLIAPAKVEPAFSGKLKLRIYNTTQNRTKIAKGEKIGSVIFFATESTKHHNAIHRNSTISERPISRINKIIKWSSTNRNQIISWLIQLACSSLAVYALTTLTKSPDPQNTNIKGAASK